MSGDLRKLQAWIAAEIAAGGGKEKGRIRELLKLSDRLHHEIKHMSVDALPVGSFQRQIAQIHTKRVMRLAMHAGYHPPEEDIKELGLQVAGQSMGLSL
jgi:hypothetical protein